MRVGIVGTGHMALSGIENIVVPVIEFGTLYFVYIGSLSSSVYTWNIY